MKLYSQCEDRTEEIARATAYHGAGRLWAEANTVETTTEPQDGPYSRSEFIAACGLIAEACSYLHDCAEGDVDDVDDVDFGVYDEHVFAAIECAQQGLHCPAHLARPGLDYLDRDEGYAMVVRDAMLTQFEAISEVAEADLEGHPVRRKAALAALRLRRNRGV